MPDEELTRRVADSVAAVAVPGLLAIVESARFNGVLESDAVRALVAAVPMTVDELATALVPIAAAFAVAPVSGYSVGAAAIGSGAQPAIYLGANLEFPAASLASTVHAEASVIVQARAHGERTLRAVSISATPCGHCRQLLHEAAGPSLTVTVEGRTATTLSTLLPDGFGPVDLGIVGSLLDTTARTDSSYDDDDPLVTAAARAAARSWAPYTGQAVGVAIRGTSGRIHAGSLVESAAFNPTITAAQAALVACRMSADLDVPPGEAVVASAEIRKGAVAADAALLAAAGVAGVRTVRLS